MRQFPATLTESVTEPLPLTGEEATALSALGRQLAGEGTWWGNAGDEPKTRATAIRVNRSAPGEWKVRVNDAVGLIHIAGKDIPVLPKIPTPHLLGLLECAEVVPRMGSEGSTLATGESLFDVFARWFVSATERVMRHDLIRDYKPIEADLTYVRGRVEVKRTSLALMTGRLAITCEFDELDVDNALNRVLLAAARTIARAPVTSELIRRSARRLISRFEGVSALQPADLRVEVTLRSRHYTDALGLAKQILRGTSRDLDVGGERAWVFLIRTPEAVEAGLRSVLDDALAPEHRVTKRGLQLTGSFKTLNPDLVFDSGAAIGDVKYKIQGEDWVTADLYQAVAFATGFRAEKGAIITFSRGKPHHAPLHVGEVTVSNFCWDAREGSSFDAAAETLGASVREWLAVGSAPERLGRPSALR